MYHGRGIPRSSCPRGNIKKSEAMPPPNSSALSCYTTANGLTLTPLSLSVSSPDVSLFPRTTPRLALSSARPVPSCWAPRLRVGWTGWWASVIGFFLLSYARPPFPSSWGGCVSRMLNMTHFVVDTRTLSEASLFSRCSPRPPTVRRANDMTMTRQV